MAYEPVMIHVKDAIVRYIDFQGCSSRAQFWNFFGFFWCVQVGVSIVEDLLDIGFLLPVSYLGLLIPYIACAVRRIRDTGYGAWLIFVPIVNIVMLFLPSRVKI